MVLRRVAIGVVVALLVLALVLAVGVTSVVRRSFAQRSGTLTLSGLSAPVTVRRDQQGVPQVYADDADDRIRRNAPGGAHDSGAGAAGAQPMWPAASFARARASSPVAPIAVTWLARSRCRLAKSVRPSMTSSSLSNTMTNVRSPRSSSRETTAAAGYRQPAVVL